MDYTPISGDYDAFMLARFAEKKTTGRVLRRLARRVRLPARGRAAEQVHLANTRGSTLHEPVLSRLLRGFTVNGQIYGFPKDWSPLGLVANAQMLQRAGVTWPHGTPATWAQLTQMMQRLRSTNAVPGGAPACLALDWARILAFMYQNNGAWVNPARDTGRDQLATERADPHDVPRLAEERPRPDAGGSPGVGWCGEAIGKEKAAIVFEGNWIYGYLQKDFPSVRFTVNPMVRGKARGNLGFTVSYSIGKDSSEQEGRVASCFASSSGKQGQSVWVEELRLPAVAQAT